MAENLVQSPNWIESWSSTDFKLVRLRHIWTINNFSFYFKTDEKLVSPTFSAETNNGELEWCLELYPNGFIFEENAIPLYLTLLNCDQREIQAECTLGIVNAEGKYVPLHRALVKFNKEVDSCGKENFLKRDSLFKEENDYLSDNKLTVFCEIAAMVGRNNTSGTFTTPQSDLVKDFEFTFENREWCDVTLSAGGKEFPAHKFILRARSPVFRAMFEHDMVESKNNRVQITDIDDEGLGEMLRYMYTGKIHKLEQVATRLLKMADKYQMDGLKSMCEKALLENLSHENAAETFILSDMFRAITLKDQVKDFIAAHATKVGNTPEFEAMVRTHPHLALEAFRVCTK